MEEEKLVKEHGAALSLLVVHVTAMAGGEISLELDTGSTVDDVRLAVSSALDVSPHALLFFVGADVVPNLAKLQQFERGDDGLHMTFIELDPMLDLGKFDAAPHTDNVEVKFADGPQGEHSIMTKTSDRRDSNNVLLLGHIIRPCFIEFEVINTRDEMSFGVTYDAERVEKASGFSNLGIKSTWLMSKKQSMPVLLFGGEQPFPREEFKHGFANNDKVMIIADPAERQVRFYRNDVLVADNLPNHPLPEFDPSRDKPLRVYCMVDRTGDEIRVVRWGPAESLLAYAKT